jgi:hypothetical protein
MRFVNALITSGALFLPVSPSVAATVITDNFATFNATRWGCEYACPTVASGFARCTLDPGAVNTTATWSKLSYKNKTFGYGSYSMTFRYSRRPLEAETWAGWALYTETGGLVNEINFGIETACQSRCSDQTLILESYKNSINSEVVVPVGASLVDGSWHSAEVIYTASKISLKFDGRAVGSILDVNTIPAVPMNLIPGARVVAGTLSSRFTMDIDSISISDSVPTIVAMRHVSNEIAAPTSSGPASTELFTISGKRIGSFTRTDAISCAANGGSPCKGIYLVKERRGNFATSPRKLLLW